ncbi:MAG TPA: hypothetical protein VLT37_07390 [Acidocella sp.]|nr:hypothetical protein [Acidocella sp.]
MTSATLRDIERQLHADAVRLAPEFAAFRGLKAELDEAARARPGLLGMHLRHALEAGALTRKGVAPALARAAAARAAAQFITAEADALTAEDRAALPAWVPAMAAEVSPGLAFLARNFGLSGAEAELLHLSWPHLGTAEALMETGGDIRLARDPKSALNGYGCSHRPRPWAITFASSTASSSSERGYVAADRMRLRTTAALLRGMEPRQAIRQSIEAVRRGIASAFGLGADERIILAASGTDTELLALALTHLAGTDQPILNILIAPEETGRGVPMAARGLHFAVDTARGHDVTFEAPIDGFRPDTALANVLLRETSGAVRPEAVVEAEIESVLATGIAEGKRVILHGLDLSKTGLLAPSPAFLAKLRAKYGDGFDFVLDACQTRLSPASLRAYLALDAVVLITGSKFFTGPPFAGAAILPASYAARLRTGTLPAGLSAYFGRDEFPAGAPSTKALQPGGNYGLSLRWHAALAEIKALLRVPPARRAEILRAFGETVRAAIAAQPALTLLEAPAISRTTADEDWECLRTIFTFSLRAPHAPERCLTPAEARQVYMWLNTDLSPLLPDESWVAARICHIGQPVPLAQPTGAGQMGALRVSAGARLISGEPSHRNLAAQARLAREFLDLNTVFLKIDLILRNWDKLAAANPAPTYRPARIAAPGLVNA